MFDPATPSAHPSLRERLRRIVRRNGVLLVFLLLTLALGAVTPGFFTWSNLHNVSTQVPVNLIIAVGMTLVIITAGIDLSVGSIVGLAGVVAVMGVMSADLAAAAGSLAVPAAVLLGVAVGGAVGLFNGAVIAYFGLPPFIVTLATMLMARGLAKVLTGGSPIGYLSPDQPQAELLNAQLRAIEPLGLGVPYPFLIALAATLLGGVLLTQTRWGRAVYAIGSAEPAARLSGIDVARVKVSVYGLAGLLAGLAGVMEAAKIQSGVPTTGAGYELTAIAAVVVGGTSLAGGRGSVLGTFVGAVLVIGVMNNMLGLHSAVVRTFWREFFSGAIILLIVLLDQLRRRRE